MKVRLHDYMSDPPPTSLHSGSERLAIEKALADARLEHRGHLRQAVLRHLPHPRRPKPDDATHAS